MISPKAWPNSEAASTKDSDVAKKTLLSRWFGDPEVEVLKHQVKTLKSRMEDVSIDDEIKALVKAVDDTSTGGNAGDFANIEEDISRSQLQKLFTTEGWFYVVVSTIANTISALPPKLEMRKKIMQNVTTEDGTVEKVEREAWADASAEPEMDYFVYPNDIQPAVEFWKLLIIDLLSTGNAFIYVDGGNASADTLRGDRLRQVMDSTNNPSGIDGLYRLSSPMVEPIAAKDGKLLEGYGMHTPAGYFKFTLDEIIHIKLPNPLNPYQGLAPIVPVLKNLLIDRYTKEHMIRFYKQGARLGGVITTKKNLTKEQITRLERTFEQNYTGRQNHHRTAVLPSEMEYKVIEQNPGETSLIEFMRYNKEPILAAYNVPPVKIGILDGASFANALIQYKVYYSDTIMPILAVLEQSINMHPTVLKKERKLRFTFDLSQIEALKENQLEKANLAKAMLDAGMTPNEVRQKVWKLGPLDGGDKAKAVEDLKGGGGGLGAFFGNSAEKPTTEKTDAANVQPDAASINPIKPTKCTFEERVAELAAASVAEGIEMEQAIMLATIQTITEGFLPTQITGQKEEETEKKTEEEALIDAPKEGVVEVQIDNTEKEVIPHFTKEQLYTYAKEMTGEAVKSYLDERKGEVDAFFDRLQKIFLKNIEKALKKRGMMSAVRTKDGDVNDDDIKKFIDDESDKSQDSMKKAFEHGYKKTLVNFDMSMHSEEVNKLLKKQAADHITAVTQTTKDQIRKILVEGQKEQVGVGEMASRIRDKFKEIKSGRAETIVRTEVLTAVSMGQDAKVQDFKKEYRKESKSLMKKWISAQDDLVRDSHEDMDDLDPIAESETYPNGLKFPRDPDGDLSERINCRCAQMVFLKEDEEEIMDILENPSSLPNEGNGEE
jgi:HK97 family phage portal protein